MALIRDSAAYIAEPLPKSASGYRPLDHIDARSFAGCKREIETVPQCDWFRMLHDVQTPLESWQRKDNRECPRRS
jgi:hypothetical protein